VTDPQRIKRRHDLRRFVEQDLGQPFSRSGRASLYKCPFHQERKGHSLVVWANGYRCFGKCDTGGDLFDWLMNYRRLSFGEALALLGETRPDCAWRPARAVAQPIESDLPTEAWQRAAREVVESAEESLWTAEGDGALGYLLGRGLSLRTIRDARLGYVPGDLHEWREIAGLKVACGITLPWFAAGVLWAVKVRRASGSPKYVQIAGGSSGGLYGADQLGGASAVLFCEGEFDALLARQEAARLVAAVTLGSASVRLAARWYGELVRAPVILAAYDRDEAGQKGAARLLALSRRVRLARLPWGKDLTEYHLQGGDVQAWIASELERVSRETILDASGQ